MATTTRSENVEVKVTLDRDQMEYLRRLERTVNAVSIMMDRAASTMRLASIKMGQFLDSMEDQK